MKVLITGGSGFIGTNLIEYYSARGADVVNIDIAKPRNKNHLRFWRKVNLCNSLSLKLYIADFSPDYIIHMGAKTDLNEKKNIDYYAANTVGLENLIQALKGLSNLKRIIFASSRLVCEIRYVPKDEFDYRPSTLYGKSKIISEKIIRSSKNIPCSWLIVRPTSIWGPWFDIPYKKFFLTIARAIYMHSGNRNPLKQMGYIGNTIYELDRLLNAPDESIHGKTIYLADYSPIRLRDWAEKIRESMGIKKIRTIPLPVLRIGGLAGDILKLLGCKHPPLTSFRINNIVTDMVYDMSLLEKIVGVLPYSVSEGVELTVEWMKAQGYI